MNKWIGMPDNTDEYFGFVYKITLKNAKNSEKSSYIGCKQFKRKTKRPPKKGKVRKTIVYRDSDWENYWGSSKELQECVKKHGKENFIREVLELTTSKWHNKYAELQWQLKENVLFDPSSFNGIINVRLGRPPKDYLIYKEKHKLSNFLDKLVIPRWGFGAKTHPLLTQQKEIIKKWLLGQKNHVTKSSRQSGTTTMAIISGLYTCMMTPNTTSAIICGNNNSIEHTIDLIQKIILHNSEIFAGLLVTREGIIFQNGSRLLMINEKSSETSLIGMNLNGFIFIDNIDYYENSRKFLYSIMPLCLPNRLVLFGTPRTSTNSLLLDLYNNSDDIYDRSELLVDSTP